MSMMFGSHSVVNLAIVYFRVGSAVDGHVSMVEALDLEATSEAIVPQIDFEEVEAPATSCSIVPRIEEVEASATSSGIVPQIDLQEELGTMMESECVDLDVVTTLGLAEAVVDREETQSLDDTMGNAMSVLMAECLQPPELQHSDSDDEAARNDADHKQSVASDQTETDDDQYSKILDAKLEAMPPGPPDLLICYALLKKAGGRQRRRARNKLKKLGSWPTGSLCSGSGQGSLASHQLRAVLCPEGEWRSRYSCESDDGEGKNLAERVFHDPEDGCVFKYVEDTSSSTSHCIKRNEECVIPSGRSGPMSVDAGFSCTSLSALKGTRQDFKNCISENKGATGKTCRATFSHYQAHQIPISFNENVPALLNESSSSNLQVLLNLAREADIAIGYRLMDARNTGHPERRPRAWLVGLGCRTLGLKRQEAQALAWRIVERSESLEIDPISLDDCLLGEGDPALDHIFNELSDKFGQEKDGAGWPGKHVAMLNTADLAWSQCVPETVDRDSRWYSLLHSRERHNLGIQTKQKPLSRTIDVYQSCDRTPTSTSPVAAAECPLALAGGAVEEARDRNLCSAVLPGSKIWDRKRHRLYTGLDLLMIQGYPVSRLNVAPDNATNRLAASLAGIVASGSFQNFFLSTLIEVPSKHLLYARNRQADIDDDNALAAVDAMLEGLDPAV